MLDSDVRYAWNGDVAIAYRTLGSGPKDFLYLPGFTSNVELDLESPAQGRFLRRIATFSRLIMIDRRGWGCSDRLSIGSFPPLETLMEDVVIVLQAIGSERAVVWGSGDNGALAILLAATHPELVSSLILYAASPSWVRREDMPWLETNEELEAYRRDMRGWGTREFAQRAYASACPSGAGDLREFEWYVRWLRLSGTPGSAMAEVDRYRDTDLRDILPTIRVPTLIVHRSEPSSSTFETARYLAQRIPDASVVRVAGEDLAHWMGDTTELLDELEVFTTGARHSRHVGRVLATVLFTDIVGSTARAAELGDAGWLNLLERHHTIVRDLLGRHRGIEIDTAGDGFFATFDGPGRAVRCALECIAALQPLGIDIRAGVHTGEVETIDGKAGGIAVNIGARVGGLAAPSEVWVSQTVKDLVAGSGLRFDDRGVHTLKGIPGDWRMHAAVATDLATGSD